MNKRAFLKRAGLLAAGATISPVWGCKSEGVGNADDAVYPSGEGFSLPDLPYGADALEPYIDTKTMEIHHGKHHSGYVRKLNSALEGTEYAQESIDVILASISGEDTGIRNNGGGHYNHSLFWSIMSPPGENNLPSGNILNAINASFGGFEAFKKAFADAALSRFGSGWAWLCKNDENQLFVSSTPNQDNPLMSNIVDLSGYPVLGLDVWEHAYYLKYQNRRSEYVENFFNLINWGAVNGRLG